MADLSTSNTAGKHDNLRAVDKNTRSDDNAKPDDKKQLNVRISTELYNKLDSENEPKGVIVTKALEQYLDKDSEDVVSSEYVSALLKQLEIKDSQIFSLNRQLETKDEQIMNGQYDKNAYHSSSNTYQSS